jgi:hypothetical protein
VLYLCRDIARADERRTVRHRERGRGTDAGEGEAPMREREGRLWERRREEARGIGKGTLRGGRKRTNRFFHLTMVVVGNFVQLTKLGVSGAPIEVLHQIHVF